METKNISPTTQNPANPKTCNKTSKLGLVLSFLNILLIISVLSFAGYNKFIVKKSFGRTQALAEQITKLADTNKELQTRLDSFEDKLNKQALLTQNKNISLLLAQNYYLVNTANFYLLYNKNAALALKNLTLASAILQKIPSKAFDSLRTTIQHDITAIENTHIYDQLATLKTIDQQITSLEELKAQDKLSTWGLKNRFAKDNDVVNLTPPANSPIQKNPTTWQEWRDHILQLLKGAVIIRHHNGNIEPILSQEDAAILLTQIECRLILAKAALLNNQVDVFRNETRTAEIMLEEYFGQYPNSALKKIIDSLKELQNIDMEKNLPSLENSVKASEQALSDLFNA